MTALLARSLGRVAAPVVAIALVLFGFELALIAVAASISMSGAFEGLNQIVPAAFRTALGPALTSFGGMAMIGYFDLIILMMVLIWGVYLATEPAGDVEGGLVDLVLARPVPRHQLVTRSLAMTFGSTLALTLAMGAGTLIGLSLFTPQGAEWPAMRTWLLMMAHLTALCWSFGAAAVAVSGWMRRRAAAITVVALAAAVLYLVDFLAMWWAPIEWLGVLTPFHYFRGGPLLAGTTEPARDLAVLGLLTLAGSVVAYWQFSRRDL